MNCEEIDEKDKAILASSSNPIKFGTLASLAIWMWIKDWWKERKARK